MPSLAPPTILYIVLTRPTPEHLLVATSTQMMQQQHQAWIYIKTETSKQFSKASSTWERASQ